MKTFLSAINGISLGQYLRINIHQSPIDFQIHQIKIWNHGLNFRGLMHHQDGTEVLHRLPLNTERMVQIIAYLGVYSEGSTIRLVNEPRMRDLNREWYFTANPREDVETIECSDFHPAYRLPTRSPVIYEDTSTHAVLDHSPLVCPECLTRWMELSVPAHGLTEDVLPALAPA